MLDTKRYMMNHYRMLHYRYYNLGRTVLDYSFAYKSDSEGL